VEDREESQCRSIRRAGTGVSSKRVPLRVNRAVLIGIAVILAVALGLGTWRYEATRPLNVARSDVVSVYIQPVPEGPALEFRRGQPYPPLLAIERYIPTPLPAPAWQGFSCGGGSDVVLGLADGRRITYGPCRWPSSIQRLRAAMSQYSRNP
jgi:hypothetical protein